MFDRYHIMSRADRVLAARLQRRHSGNHRRADSNSSKGPNERGYLDGAEDLGSRGLLLQRRGRLRVRLRRRLVLRLRTMLESARGGRGNPESGISEHIQQKK